MPRTKLSPAEQLIIHPGSLVGLLSKELKSPKTFGQPVISEEPYKTGLIRVRVLWDRWAGFSHEDRTLQIVMSYRESEGDEFADRITLATGLTFPEAISSGMLPYQVIAALRKNDPVTAEQCRHALIEEGASMLLDPLRPELRFASQEEAEAAVERLSSRLLESEEVWQIVPDPFRGFVANDEMVQ